MSVWISTIDTVVTYHSFVVSLNNGNDNGLTSDKRICTDSFDTESIRISYFILVVISRMNVYELVSSSSSYQGWMCIYLFHHHIKDECIWRLYDVWWVGGLLLSVYAHNTITEQHCFLSILFSHAFGFSFSFGSPFLLFSRMCLWMFK